MKLPRIAACAAIVAILAVSLSVPTSQASAKKPAPAASFEGSPGWDKVDLRFRQAWKEAVSKGDEGARLECIIKTISPASDDEKAWLKSAGFAARTYIGAIVTGSVAAKDLPSVAGLKFVSAMELAVPLTIKKGK